MKFFMFHLMPWPHLPADFEEHHRSDWVTCPNTYYDANLGTTVYNDYLDQLQSAEALGFDGVCTNFATKVLPQLREDIRRKFPHLLKSKAAAALLEETRA